MFAKAVAPFLFAACAIAGLIEPGDYRIANVDYGSLACVYSAGGPVYVCPEPRDPFDIVSLRCGHFCLNTLNSYLLQPAVEY